MDPVRRLRHCAAVAAATALALALVGCGPGASAPVAPAAQNAANMAPWAAVQAAGTLRVAVRTGLALESLPAQGLSAEQYQRLVEQFAERHGLEVAWIYAPSVGGVLRLVADGQADLGVANITVTAERRRRVAFSVPLTRSREWVIGTAEDGRFGVPAATSYEATLAARYPQAPRAPLPTDADPATIAALIEDGAIEATIMDEAVARAVLRGSADIVKLRELPPLRDHAWALPQGAGALKAALDAFLLERHVLDERPAENRDWPAVVAAGRLRLLTVNTPTSYYLWRGELLGYDYELVRDFAVQHGLALEVVVGASIEELFELLIAGRGDVIAAGLTSTPTRTALGVAFSKPYVHVRETFVTAGAPIERLADLAGRRVTVHPATSYAATLGTLADVGFEVVHARQPTQAILDTVAAGAVDATLADSHRAGLAATFHPNLALGLGLAERGLAWAVRAGNDELLRRLNAYVDEGYRGYRFNTLFNKYFVNTRRMARQREHRVTGSTLSPYDDLVKAAVADTGIDWRLVVAQMYQESGFDPAATSFAGAKGLLQVLPATAREVGVAPERLADPAAGIGAGVEYLAWCLERFPQLAVGEQVLFALAAYNAGAGHVRDGRRLAKRLALDDSRWFGHVEQAMLRLEDPAFAAQAAHGYARGSEVTSYVRGIHNRYRAYRDHFEGLAARAEAEQG